MIGRTGIVSSLVSTFRSVRALSGRKDSFLPDEACTERNVETKKETIPVLPIMSLFNQFSTGSEVVLDIEKHRVSNR